MVSQNVSFIIRTKKLADAGILPNQKLLLKNHKAPLFESSGQASYYFRKRFNPRFRRDIRWSDAGPRVGWSGGRQKFCWPLQP